MLRSLLLNEHKNEGAVPPYFFEFPFSELILELNHLYDELSKGRNGINGLWQVCGFIPFSLNVLRVKMKFV